MALSKEAAQAITADLDKLAQLFETDHAALGVPTNVAKDFAYRCDLLSDFVEKQAAAQLDRTDSIQKEFDQEVAVSHQPDEAYMSDKTTQDELYELGQMVESGNLGKAALENIASKVADLLKAAADEEEKEADEEEDDKEADEEESDKKAHLLNLANSLLRLAADEDDADDSDDSDEKEDKEDDADEKEDDDADEGADKEASFTHGYSL